MSDKVNMMTATCNEVTFDVMLTALRRTMGTNIEDDALKRIAEYVLNIFGYGTYHPDYRLNQEERNLFYLLEDRGFVMTHEEKLTFPRGGSVRIGFWILRKRYILGLANMEDDPTCEEEVEETVEDLYANLGQEAWERGEAADEVSY